MGDVLLWKIAGVGKGTMKKAKDQYWWRREEEVSGGDTGDEDWRKINEQTRDIRKDDDELGEGGGNLGNIVPWEG